MAKTQKYKHQGFIDGLKANNISTNRSSLDIYSKQIEIICENIINANQLSVVATQTLQLGQETIRKIEEEKNPQDLINLYIKFGDVLKSITPMLKGNFSDDLKMLVINYLNIARYTNDTRVYNIAIDIAADAES